MKYYYYIFMLILGFIFLFSAFYNYDNPAKITSFLFLGAGCWLCVLIDITSAK